MTEDLDIQHRIHALIDEEHRLRESRGPGEITPGEEHERVRPGEGELYHARVQLRQRRAKREYGRDPHEAEVRPERTVEGYVE